LKKTLSLKPTPGKDLARYLGQYPDEHVALLDFSELLEDGTLDPLSRANETGHVVTSGLVLDQTQERVLVIDHLVLKRWLPPGGHYEGSGSLMASARREVLEETGVAAIEPIRLADGTSLLDINKHRIPANPAKAEGEHWHFDFLYLFQAAGDVALTAQEDEVAGVKWLSLEEFAATGSRAARATSKLQAYFQDRVVAATLEADNAREASIAAAPREIPGETPPDVSAFFDALSGQSDDDEAQEPDALEDDEPPLTVADLASLSLFR